MPRPVFFEGAPFEDVIDPHLGLVLGHAWGCDGADLIAAYPNIEIMVDEGDLQVLELPHPFLFCGMEAQLSFSLVMDSLLAIRMSWSATESSSDELNAIFQWLVYWFGVEPEELDDGFFGMELATVKVSIDLYDRFVVLEDAEVT